MNRIHITAAALLLAGCATHTEMTLPDGSKGYNVSCDGAVLSMGDCFQKAGELCPQGYDVLGRDGSATPFGYGSGQAGGNPQGWSGGYTQTYGAIVTRDLYVRCKQGQS